MESGNEYDLGELASFATVGICPDHCPHCFNSVALVDEMISEKIAGNTATWWRAKCLSCNKTFLLLEVT